ncbi:MAG: glycosyltransferase family 2 protein [Anaerolineales bacterium]|nr:glycosyltransferase family 2 protein [Anaerolineales bacterium]
MSAERVTVIVVNYNGAAHIERCLRALLAQSYPAHEIVVIDNASTDGSLELARSFAPAINCIPLAENAGFARANNLAARAARGEWIALINNDAFAAPGWLQALVDAARRAPEIGLVASQMVFDAQPDLINSTGVCIDRTGVVWDRGGGAMTLPSGPPVPVFGPSGGAALYRRELWQALGGLREDYFMYFEDVDLAWQANWLGARSVLAPAAHVRHVVSASLGQASPAKTFWLARNKWLLLARNYPRPYLWRYLPLITAYDLLSFTATGLAGQWAAAGKGRMEGLRLAAAKAALGPAHQARPATAATVWEQLEPVAAPWRVRARYAHLGRVTARPARP